MTIGPAFICNKERVQPDGLCPNREERWAGLALMDSCDYPGQVGQVLLGEC